MELNLARDRYCDDAFARLVLNPEIMRVVNALTGGNQTLVDTALIKMDRSGGTKNEGGFHGELGQHVPSGSKVPGEQWKDYHVTPDGDVFAGFLNCGVTLVDVPEGSGFVCIPGSHKRSFAIPDNDNVEQCLTGASIRQIDLYDGVSAVGSPYRYTVQNICPKAGTAIIFTESLRHGIRKWEATYPRLTVFNRYKANWPQRYWGTRKQGPISSESLDACADQLPEEIRRLQEPSAGAEAKDSAVAQLAAAYTAAMEAALAMRANMRVHKL